MDAPRFPSGWFRVGATADLRAGRAKPIRYFGRDLVLFRGRDGKARLLDAHCPHMGAHLAYGGEVRGDSIVCPFHGWRFDGAGRCVEIPYCRKIPAQATTGSWPVREFCGQTLAYFSEDGGTPSWECPEPARADPADWSPFRKVHHWPKTRAHIEEFTQNGLDMAHFPQVHAGLPISQEGLPRFDGPFLRFDHRLRFPKTGTSGLAQQINAGLGLLLMRVELDAGRPISYHVLFFFTPIEHDWCEIYAVMSLKKAFNPVVDLLLTREIRRGTVKNFSADLRIFEHKVFGRRLLCEGDGTVALFQRWVRQFYGSAAPVPVG